MSELQSYEKNYIDEIIENKMPKSENEITEDEQQFRSAIYMKLSKLIPDVVSEVRSKHPTITDESKIAQLVREAISVAGGIPEKITINSGPSPQQDDV